MIKHEHRTTLLAVKLNGKDGYVVATDLDTLIHAGPYDLINVFMRAANGDEHQHPIEKREVVFCGVGART